MSPLRKVKAAKIFSKVEKVKFLAVIWNIFIEKREGILDDE
jgi:hypothetical protein